VTEQLPDQASDTPAVHKGAKGAFDLARAVWQRAPGDDSNRGIEVAFVDDLIGLRNSAQPAGPVLVFTKPEWEAFVAGAQNGEFDL
jgi:Domain of unknown function (DUF397)